MPPPPEPPPTTKLVLTTNSLRNTTISNGSDTIYYEIRTESWVPLHTKVNRLDPETRAYEVRAEIQCSGDVPPTVRVAKRSREWVRADEFLRFENGGGSGELRKPHIAGRFMGDDGRMYRWEAKGRRLELFRADIEQPEPPVVIRHGHSRHFFVFRMSNHAWLEVKPEVHDTLDCIILSYLLIERKRRHADKEIGFL